MFHSLQKPDFFLLGKLKYKFSRIFPKEFLENAQGPKKTIKFPSLKCLKKIKTFREIGPRDLNLTFYGIKKRTMQWNEFEGVIWEEFSMNPNFTWTRYTIKLCKYATLSEDYYDFRFLKFYLLGSDRFDFSVIVHVKVKPSVSLI